MATYKTLNNHYKKLVFNLYQKKYTMCDDLVCDQEDFILLKIWTPYFTSLDYLFVKMRSNTYETLTVVLEKRVETHIRPHTSLKSSQNVRISNFTLGKLSLASTENDS